MQRAGATDASAFCMAFEFDGAFGSLQPLGLIYLRAFPQIRDSKQSFRLFTDKL
jgi:hypothetical protein